MINRTYSFKVLLGFLCCLVFLEADTQNITSPYSVLGIGDIDNKEASKYFITGSSSISRRDAGTFNYSNPASITGLSFKTMTMDVTMLGKVSRFKMPGDDSSLALAKDMAIKRISLAFRTGEKSGFAFGLRPYSSVNYKFRENPVILDGNTDYTKYIEGNAGINQFFFSAATTLSKKFSAGITAAWLFGSLQRTTTYYSSSIDLNVVKEDRDMYNGALFTGGLQYYSSGKKWKHQLGITGTASTGLTGQLTTSYYDAGYLITRNLENDREFSLPLSAGIGYTAIHNDHMVITADARYDHWKKQKLEYTNSYTGPAVKLSGGMEFLFKNPRSANPADRPYLGWGVSAENSYLHIRNQKLWDYSLSFGGGFSLTRNISVYTGIEAGQRGNPASNQIKENYTKFSVGLSIRDIWLGTKKFGRFD